MLRGTFKSSLLSCLDYDVFRYGDFEIKSHVGELMIGYDNFYFNITVCSTKKQCTITCKPGEVLTEDTEIMSLNRLQMEGGRHIKNWLIRVKTELCSPIQQRLTSNQIEQFKEELQEKLQKVDDSFFLKEEGEQLKQKLEELERLFFKESEEKKEINDELQHMKSEMEFLKATVDTLPKKKWLKNAMVKIWAWGQKEENKKLMQAGFETIKTITQLDASDIK